MFSSMWDLTLFKEKKEKSYATAKMIEQIKLGQTIIVYS